MLRSVLQEHQLPVTQVKNNNGPLYKYSTPFYNSVGLESPCHFKKPAMKNWLLSVPAEQMFPFWLPKESAFSYRAMEFIGFTQHTYR